MTKQLNGEIYTALDVSSLLLMAALGGMITTRYLSGSKLMFSAGAALTGFLSNWDSWVSMQGPPNKPAVYGALLAVAFGNNPNVFGFHASPAAGIVTGSSIFSLWYYFRKRQALLTKSEDTVF